MLLKLGNLICAHADFRNFIQKIMDICVQLKKHNIIIVFSHKYFIENAYMIASVREINNNNINDDDGNNNNNNNNNNSNNNNNKSLGQNIFTKYVEGQGMQFCSKQKR